MFFRITIKSQCALQNFNTFETKMCLSEYYSGTEWFQHNFGFRETVGEVYKHLALEEQSQGIVIKSKINNKQFLAGRFSKKSPSDFIKHEKRGSGRFNIIHGTGNCSLNDIITLQNHPEFKE